MEDGCVKLVFLLILLAVIIFIVVYVILPVTCMQLVLPTTDPRFRVLEYATRGLFCSIFFYTLTS